MVQNVDYDDDDDDFNDVEAGNGIITLLIQCSFHSSCHRDHNLNCSMLY